MSKFFSASLIWLLSIVGILVVQFIAVFALIALPSYANIVQYATMALVQIINVSVVVYFRKKRNFISPYTFKKPTLKNVVKSIAVGLLTFVGMFLISQYVFEFFSILGAKTAVLDISGWYLLPAIFSTVILAPCGEEILFRSSLVYGLDNGKRVRAILLSALAFALMHMSPMQTVYQFALGVALATLIIKTENVVYPVIAHATSNLAVIILSFINLPDINLFSPLTIILAFAIFSCCLVLAYLVLKSMTQKDKRDEVSLQVKKTKGDGLVGAITYGLGVFVCLIVWFSAFI